MTVLPRRVPVLVPDPVEADELSAILKAIDLEAVICRDAEALADAIATGYAFVVVSSDRLTPATAGMLRRAWAAEPDWSHPALVVLLDRVRPEPAALRGLLRRLPWIVPVNVQRPWQRRKLLAAFRRQVAFRTRQYRAAETVRKSEEMAQQQQALRLALDHSTKNLLANMQSMVRLAVRAAGHGESLADRLGDRLHALARVHELLAHSPDGVPLQELVVQTLAAHPAAADRVVIEGEDCPLTPRAATSLALAVHELVDNAARHGALRDPRGRIGIRWRTEYDAGEARLRLVWTEEGPEPLPAPGPKGFGCRMLEQVLPVGLRGRSALAFRPDGLRFSLDAPVRSLSPVRD